jgi:hypothetical protein
LLRAAICALVYHRQQSSAEAHCTPRLYPSALQHDDLASQPSARRSFFAVSRARSCAYRRRAPPVCASHDTRTMFPASSRRAADAAPFARRKTRPPSRTGSIEGGRSEKEQEWQHGSVCDTAEDTWEESGNDTPMVEMTEDIFHALERLARRDSGKKRTSRSTILV